MQYFETSPSPDIAPYVRCFWSLSQTRDESVSSPERVLPDGNPELVFNLADRFRRHSAAGSEIQPAAIVVGQMTRFVMIEPTGAVELFGVRFHPYGLLPLLGDSADQMTDRIESLSNIMSGSNAEIEERLATASDFRSRIRCFEQWFRGFFPQIRKSRNLGLLERATRLIDDADGAVRIREINSALGIGSKKLERLFRNALGVSPKTYARVARLKCVVRAIDGGRDWAETAYRSGYFDQAHFIKDFREFSGITPGAFVRETNRMNEAFTAADVDFLQ